jgi:DNA-binding transcriptional regulator YdaS (Cro superfamily)
MGAGAMTPDDLRNVAEAVFGPRWQRELGRAIGTNDRTVRYWVSGERQLPADLAERIDAAIISQITALVAARRDLQRLRKDA